jgi:hypothetical protein
MSDLNRIMTSKPVNATTGRVMGQGVHWKPAKVEQASSWQERSDAPLPTIVFKGDTENDLTGQRFGRLCVAGPSAQWKSTAKGVAWVVRCDCGYFETRRTKSLKAGVGDAASMCSHCAVLEDIKRGSHKTPTVLR